MGSRLPWGSLSLILVLLLQSKLHSSSGCFVEERAALLDIRSSLVRTGSPGTLDSWGKDDDDDCCSWELSHLDLNFVSFTTDVDDRSYLNLTVFSAFHELQYLDISYNYPCSLSSEGLVGLSKLRYLDLSGTLLGEGFPEFIGKIVSLEVLALNYNYLNGGLPATAVENLRNLQQLNMSGNRFNGNLPQSLFSLPRLKILDLSTNHFSGHIPVNSSSGPISPEVLDLSFNRLNGTLPVTAFKNIRSLNLGGNQFSGSLPVSLFALPHLKFLDLSHNNFEGRFPIDLSFAPIPLEVLHLEYNKLSGPLPTEQGDFEGTLEPSPLPQAFMLHLSSGCFVEERDALLDIQSSLIRAGSPGTLDSWRKDGGDCCSWEAGEMQQ
ncbi:hypothetical protein ZWY2020_006880 [Hordeum vulgare]|nr:hypothetical protein ZWY2020_006880 [Hordeum vulgare]